MKQSLTDYLSGLSRAFVQGARAATKESVQLAGKTDDLDVTTTIGGVELKVEGAANLPSSVMMLKSTEFSTEAFVELDREGQPMVTLKRGLLGTAARMEVKMEFERTQPLESVEIARDRALEVMRDNVQKHRIKVAMIGSGIQVEALEESLAEMKAKQETDHGPTDE